MSDFDATSFRYDDKEMLRVALSDISDGILVLDNSNQVLWINKTAGRILGIYETQYYGKSITEIFPSFGGDNFIESMRKSADEGSIFPVDFRYSSAFLAI